MNRRNFFFSMGAMGLTAYNSRLSFSINHDNNPKCSFNDNSIIYVFLHGGPTHIETFNPIPEATSERRSVVGYLDTNVPGMRIGGLWDNLANKADKYCVVNSFSHRDANHESAQHWMLTGEPNTPNAPQKWPSYGSVVCGQYGTNDKKSGLPNYVKLSSINYDSAAWMGNKFQGYAANSDGISDLLLTDEKRFKDRLRMLQTIDENSKLDSNNIMSKGWTDLREQASDLLFGKAGEAFVLENDPEYNTYTGSKFGEDLLTAMRLVERGVKFVNVMDFGWDMHQSIAGGMKVKVPNIDTYLSRLLESLEKRSLNQRVMLVVSGDFGRTPKINQDAGRDHWPSLVPLLIANDSYDMGRIIGSSDSNGDAPKDNPFEPEDLKWTILSHIGLHKDADWYSIDNRPQMFIKDSAKNILTGAT